MLLKILHLRQLLVARLLSLTGNSAAIGNAFWLSADQIVRRIVALGMTVWTARALGPEDFGSLNFAFSFIAIFAAFSTLGFDNLLVRNLARRPDDAAREMGAMFGLRLGGNLLALLTGLAVIFLLRPRDHDMHTMVLLLAIANLFLCSDVIDRWFEARVQSKYAVWARNGAFLLATLARIVLLLLHAPVTWFAAALTLESALVAVGLVWIYRKRGQSIRLWRWETSYVRLLLRESWPLILCNACMVLQAYLDQILLGQHLGDHVVGQYAVALGLVLSVSFVPLAIARSLAPAIAQAHHAQESHLYHARLHQLYSWMALASYGVIVPSMTIGPLFVRFLFGADYQLAAQLLPLMSWRLLFTAFIAARLIYINNEAMFRYNLWACLAGVIANTAANLALIPLWGPWGAMAGTSAALALTLFGLDLWHKPTRANALAMLGSLNPVRLYHFVRSF